MTAISAEGRAGTGRAIGDVIAGKEFTKTRRTGQPVWRNSYYEGQIEKRLWRPIGDGTRRGGRRYGGAVLKSAKELERKTLRARQRLSPGCRNGALGHVAIEVLEALYMTFVDYKEGRLEPAIATIAEAVGRSYSAVHAALKRLRDAGFLHWIRRSKPTENATGPQVEQITNAYALDLPPEVAQMVRHLMGRAPLPDDVKWAGEQRQAEWKAMVESLSAERYLEAMGAVDGRLGETLKSIARMLDKRESSTRRETGSW